MSDSEEKWAPQASPDGTWVVYLSWLKPANAAPVTAGSVKRVPVIGGPPEGVMEIKGHPAVASAGYVEATVGGFPSFRCPTRAGASCVLAEADDKQITFTAFDPQKGRINEVARVPGKVDFSAWDLSADGASVALATFDFKTGDVQIFPVAGGNPQKFSGNGWTQIVAVAWAADGKSLYLASASSRGTAILRSSLTGDAKLVLKSVWEIQSIYLSPDGHSLALGSVIINANAWIIPNLPDR